MTRLRRACLALFALPLLALPAAAEDSFSKRLGAVKVGDVKPAPVYDLPFLTWGGDVATFIANGGDKETKKDTLFDKQGIKVNLVNGDDFLGQVKNYLEGKTPFLRGTLSQLGQASEALGQDPRTAPVVFLQLTWSAGDHMVARPTCKTLNDLKGKKIVLQEGGPHAGMLDDALKSAGLKWSDIKVVWAKNVTAVKGEPDKDPAAMFRKDPTIDACFVISPDMVDLTGGLEKTGDGSEKSVKGAKVLVSTVYLDHSIADVYACRKDYFDKNKAQVEKLTAAYLKASEDLVDLRKNHEAKEKDKAKEDRYKTILAMTKTILGEETIPDAWAAHGLIMDAAFAALPGNYSFFKDEKNTANFERRAKSAVDMAVAQGWASKRFDLTAADFDYANLKKIGDLKADLKLGEKKFDVKVEDFKPEDTIVFFSVQFGADESRFDEAKYKEAFKKAIEEARLYGSGVIVVRGHVDVTKVLSQFVKAGLANNTLTRAKVGDVTKYYLKKTGKEIDITNTRAVLDLITKSDDFKTEAPEDNPQLTVKAAQKLSEERAQAVRKAILALSETIGAKLNENQFKTEGVGVVEPVIAKPKNEEDAALNRRAEFRIYKVTPEKVTKADFID